MIRIGLTGGIGCGKSTISNFLKEIGIKVVDADLISREVLQIYPEILEKIALEFGADVLCEDGRLNRRKLGEIVFASKEKKEKLESIIIPFVLGEINNRIEAVQRDGENCVVVDAPTLMENNIDRDMDYNIVVWVDRETQIERILQRDKLSRDNILNRIDSQMPLAEKKNRAQYIIDNSGDVKNTLEQVKKIFDEILRMEK